MARGLVFVSTVVSHSLAYVATDVMDNDNLVTALEAQIQINVVLIGTVGKASIDLILYAKRWGITLKKPRRLFTPQLREGSGLCSTLCCQDDSE